MTRAPPAAASSRVRSVECESTTMISSQKSTERRHASMRSASLKVMMHAVRPLSFATGTSASPGDNSPYNTPAMSQVLFYDPLCQQPYDTRTLHTQAMGGTEATLVRVADALDAWVIQHNRSQDWERYRRPQRLDGVTSVIVNRDSRALTRVRQRYPGARVYLWLHDR